MSWLSNASVKQKAIGAFSVVLLCAVALGGFAVNRLSVVNDEAAAIRDNWLPSATAIAGLNIAFDFYRVVEGAHVMATTPEEIATEDRTLEETARSIAEKIKAYERLLTPGWETETFRKFNASWNHYLAISTQQLLPLSRKNDNEKAGVIFRGASRDEHRKSKAILEELISYNQREAIRAANAGEAIYLSSRLWIIGALVAVVAGCIAAGWMIVVTVARPVQTMTGVMGRLADHDMGVAIDGTERKDEIGAMARAVQVFKDGLIEADRLAAIQVAEQQAKQRRAEAIDRMVVEFDASASTALRTVAAAASELDATAHSMSAMAEQTNAQANVVASAAEQTSANVQTVATATEEMASSIREIGGQVIRSADIAGKAVGEAARTSETVRSLSEAAQKIGEVVGLITDIASQTNLLALNATIEAARAGEAGKGFAVVASEVKSLAGQTAKATEEIASQISAIQQTTQGVVQAIAGIGETIGSINDITTGIAAAIEEQSAATNEISRSVQQAACGTQEVTGSIIQVTQAAGEAGSAAGQVLGAAGELSRQAETLRHDVENFIVRIKAA
ncbi:methyl-accepting chemotaxis protein [Azospirillum agricola]|uniref:HAMP domain-containing methyl-accepting chemotaxis protein n=1 Tax=Azospirillum agricola TaxID=1720247 RepID=UPI001AE4EADD|nr:methyl-accepting chemotaxis protein [Azospirillum agricola]MBP2229250.1 methyl-accepting chemotaxis protein [Azospirillum agricola]